MVPFAGVVRPSAADLQAKGEEAFLPTATFRIFSFESVHLFIYFFAWEPSPSLSSSSGDRTSLCCTWVNRAPNRSMEQRKIIIESVSFFFSPRHLLSGKDEVARSRSFIFLSSIFCGRVNGPACHAQQLGLFCFTSLSESLSDGAKFF